jgi:hypothetical protein
MRAASRTLRPLAYVGLERSSAALMQAPYNLDVCPRFRALRCCPPRSTNPAALRDRLCRMMVEVDLRKE